MNCKLTSDSELLFWWLCPGAKKKQLHVDKPDDDVVVNAYDDIDDYDFM